MIIYHLVRKDAWKKYQKDRIYAPPSLKRDGFIHCSTKKQVLATANRRFAGAKDLLLLVIDTNKVSANIVFEDLHNIGKKHPHIYGPLPISAIQAICTMVPNNDGVFTNLPVK